MKIVFTKSKYLKAKSEHKKGRELVGIIQRLGGTKEDYKKMYNWIKFKEKPFK